MKKSVDAVLPRRVAQSRRCSVLGASESRVRLRADDNPSASVWYAKPSRAFGMFLCQDYSSYDVRVWRNGYTHDIRDLVGASAYDEYSSWEVHEMNKQGQILATALKPINPSNPANKSLRVLILLPVEVKWEAKDEWNNIDDHKDPWTNEINGKRIFPDAVAPQPSDWRREAIVKVRIPGLGGKEVHLKAIDVDDTSAIDDPDHILDSNDTSSQKAGDDNLKGEGLIAEWGQFLPDLAKKVTVTLDSNGEAEVEFRVNQQPGNNYRVAVALEEEDLSYLQVSNSNEQGYVTPDSKGVNGFKGAISPMLTVWRKLHIEQDSMEAAPDPKPSPDQVQATGSHWERQGPRSVLHLSGSLPEGSNFYHGGKIKSGSVEFDIFENTSSTITLGHGNNNVPTEAEFNAFVGQFDVLDDDERGTGPLLPNHNLITEGVKAKYRYAFIDVVNVESSQNPSKTIVFDANESPYWPPPTTDLDDSKDMGGSDSVAYWYHYVIAAYQGPPSEDNDPGGEPPLEGITVWWGSRSTDFSAIFVETIRDKLTLPDNDPNYMEKYTSRLDEVVAHEIGHVPSRESGHYESELMSDAGSGHDFAPESLSRFRKTPSWDASW